MGAAPPSVVVSLCHRHYDGDRKNAPNYLHSSHRPTTVLPPPGAEGPNVLRLSAGTGLGQAAYRPTHRNLLSYTPNGAGLLYSRRGARQHSPPAQSLSPPRAVLSHPPGG